MVSVNTDANPTLGISTGSPTQNPTPVHRVERYIKPNESMEDASRFGLGAMVDADPAEESALLRLIEIREQLAAQGPHRQS
jgi:hypothetical protein